MFKTLVALAVVAVVTATATEEVRIIEAKLAAAKEKFAAEQNVNSVNHSEGQERNARAETSSRYVRETETIFTLVEKVKALDALMTTLEHTQNAQLASVPGSVKTLEISINAAVSSVKRVDGIASDITDLDAEVDQIPSAAKIQTDLVAEKMKKLESDMAALSVDVTAKNTAALASVDAKIKASQVETEKAATALAASVVVKNKEVVTAASKLSGDKTTYIHWGSHTCKGPNNPQLAYKGWTFATYHNHRGGTTPQCLRNEGGTQGGQAGGWDSLDWLYASRTDNCAGTDLNSGKCGKNIPCSVCTRDTKCYLETSTATCSAEGYKTQYYGWLLGSYLGHSDKQERICVDAAGDGWGPDNGSGSYFYPNTIKHATPPRSDSRTMRCSMCCLE